jgi:hypothetical protein
MKRLVILLFLMVSAVSVIAEDSYEKEISQWQERRARNLRGEDGWLTLVGLYWLKEGENKVGSDASSDILLPRKAPKLVAKIRLDKTKAHLTPAPGVDLLNEGNPVASSIELKPDASGEPTILTLGSLSFYVIERAGRLGVRIKDKENPDRVNFAGLEYFPVNPEWKIEAKFERYDPPKKIPILNIVGFMENQPCPGAVIFQMAGKTYRIDALQEEDELFLIFSDETSGRETYGAGRYLYTPVPGPDNKVVLDFNKAYNPPCAFTPYATCPLPPRQNRLALRVEAGEKNYTAGKSASH